MIRNLAVDWYAIINRIGKGLIGLFREILLHCLPVEDVLSIILGYFVRGGDRLYRLAVGGLLHGVEA